VLEEETMEERITEQPLDPDERRMIGAILEMEDTVVREIMKPRVDVIALDVEFPLDQIIDEMVKSGHSRVPVFEETLDNILGILYSRDLLAAVVDHSNREGLNVRDLLRQPFFVPETKRVDELLREFQEQRVRMGIVIDEYGGVEGLVTMEDLLEEIVGELEDEFQPVTAPTFEMTQDGSNLVDARIRIQDFNAKFNSDIDEEVFETLAGFLYSSLGKIPSIGDNFRVDGLTLEIFTTLGRRMKQVKVTVNTGGDDKNLGD
jgi:CBS domain containing-hemolysin-like protein